MEQGTWHIEGVGSSPSFFQSASPFALIRSFQLYDSFIGSFFLIDSVAKGT